MDFQRRSRRTEGSSLIGLVCLGRLFVVVRTLGHYLCDGIEKRLKPLLPYRLCVLARRGQGGVMTALIAAAVTASRISSASSQLSKLEPRWGFFAAELFSNTIAPPSIFAGQSHVFDRRFPRFLDDRLEGDQHSFVKSEEQPRFTPRRER